MPAKPIFLHDTEAYNPRRHVNVWFEYSNSLIQLATNKPKIIWTKIACMWKNQTSRIFQELFFISEKSKKLFPSYPSQVNTTLYIFIYYLEYIYIHYTYIYIQLDIYISTFPVDTFNNSLSSVKGGAKIPVPKKTKALSLHGTIQILYGYPTKIWRQIMPSDMLSKSKGHLSLHVLCGKNK